MNAQLRTTSWPGEPVAVPPVAIPDHVELDGEWLRFRQDKYEGTYRELPDEFYLRQARDTDLEDLDAVADLVNVHGRVAPTWPLTRDLPRRAQRTSSAELARFSARRGRRYNRADVANEVGVGRVHVDEVIYRLTVLRSLTNHFLAYREGEYEYETWPKPALHGTTREELTVSAWELFTEFINAALAVFQVRVWVDVGDPDLDIGRVRPTVYEAGVLQLVNDLSQEIDLLHCQHCGRAFFRQVGRSESQSRLKGVMYCSPSCSRAASVKAYRARKRAEQARED